LYKKRILWTNTKHTARKPSSKRRSRHFVELPASRRRSSSASIPLRQGIDLYRVIATYADAGNTDRLYDSEIPLLEQVNYDLELAGAALAGRDARQLSGPATLTRLGTFLVSDFMDMLAERIRASRWPLEPEQLPRLRTMLSTFSEYLSG
jgi:hypothetical protein